MKIVFSHGKESGPRGFKIRRLSVIGERFGCAVDSIDYTDTLDPDRRVTRLLEALGGETGDFILVGSSMGGYVSLVASATTRPRAVFLMAPALFIPGYGVQEYRTNSPLLEIVHGWADDVIPVEHSIRYAREAGCSLHLVRGDHPLNDSIGVVESLFEAFLRRVLHD